MNSALHFINLLFGGILAGMELALHYGLRAPAAALNDRAQLQLRQALVFRLRVLVPAFFVPTAFSAVAIAVLDGPAAFRIVGLLALLTWVIVRVIGTVPINSASITWSLDAPPDDWKAQIARAERFHDLGVWAVVSSFVCALMNQSS